MTNYISYNFKENIEQKYNKALIQIKKVHNANQLMRNQFQQMKISYENQISFLQKSLDNLQKDHNNIINHEKSLIQQFQILTKRQQNLKKQINDLQHDKKDLNELLKIQSTQLKKHNYFKQDKGLVMLICSYEQRQQNYKKDINRDEQIIKVLKLQCQQLQNQLRQQRRIRFKLQQLNNNLKIQRDQFKELNNALMQKNQIMITNLFNKNHQNKHKYQQAQQIITQLNKYILTLKTTQLQHKNMLQQTIHQSKYDQLLQQKMKMHQQVRKLSQQLQKYYKHEKQMYTMEQKMNKAIFQAQQLKQECNYLKNKIILFQTKQIIENNSQQTQIINNQNNKDKQRDIIKFNGNRIDKQKIISNVSNTNNFQLMKTFIIQLNQKLQKNILQKKQLQKKNTILKQKLSDKASKLSLLQQQKNVMKAKIQGLQGLAQKSCKQLQLSTFKYQEQLSKIKEILYNIINKKTLQQKITKSCISNNQSIHSQDRQLVQKNKKQLQILNSQLIKNKIKINQINKQKQQKQYLLTLSKNKLQQIKIINIKNQQTLILLKDNCTKYQKLYNQQKQINQNLMNQIKILSLLQFNNLINKNNIINNINNSIQKPIFQSVQFKNKQSDYLNQLKSLNNSLLRSNNSNLSIQNSIKILKNQIYNRKHQRVQSIANDLQIDELQNKLKLKNQENAKLVKQIEEFKVKMRQFQEIKIRFKHEQEKRKYLQLNNQHYQHLSTNQKQNYERSIRQYELQIKEITSNYHNLVSQNTVLKKKIELQQKQLQNIKSKSIDGLTSFQKIPTVIITPQKISSPKVQSNIEIEYQELKSEKKKSQQILSQIKRKEFALAQQLIQLRNFYEQKCEECQQLKIQLQNKNDIQQRLESSIDHLEILNQGLNEQNFTFSQKLQQINKQYAYIKDQVLTLKYYLSDIQLSCVTHNWQQQQRYFFNTFIEKIKNLIRICQDPQKDNQLPKEMENYIHFGQNPISERIYQSYDYIHNRGESYPHSLESYSVEQS